MITRLEFLRLDLSKENIPRKLMAGFKFTKYEASWFFCQPQSKTALAVTRRGWLYSIAASWRYKDTRPKFSRRAHPERPKPTREKWRGAAHWARERARNLKAVWCAYKLTKRTISNSTVCECNSRRARALSHARCLSNSLLGLLTYFTRQGAPRRTHSHTLRPAASERPQQPPERPLKP